MGGKKQRSEDQASAREKPKKSRKGASSSVVSWETESKSQPEKRKWFKRKSATELASQGGQKVPSSGLQQLSSPKPSADVEPPSPKLSTRGVLEKKSSRATISSARSSSSSRSRESYRAPTRSERRRQHSNSSYIKKIQERHEIRHRKQKHRVSNQIRQDLAIKEGTFKETAKKVETFRQSVAKNPSTGKPMSAEDARKLFCADFEEHIKYMQQLVGILRQTVLDGRLRPLVKKDDTHSNERERILFESLQGWKRGLTPDQCHGLKRGPSIAEMTAYFRLSKLLDVIEDLAMWEKRALKWLRTSAVSGVKDIWEQLTVPFYDLHTVAALFYHTWTCDVQAQASQSAQSTYTKSRKAGGKEKQVKSDQPSLAPDSNAKSRSAKSAVSEGASVENSTQPSPRGLDSDEMRLLEHRIQYSQEAVLYLLEAFIVVAVQLKHPKAAWRKFTDNLNVFSTKIEALERNLPPSYRLPVTEDVQNILDKHFSGYRRKFSRFLEKRGEMK